MTRIAIDLVPLRPGGVNGGAGLMVRYFLEHLPEMGQGLEYLILAAPWNQDELSRYARPGVVVQVMDPEALPGPGVLTARPRALDFLLSVRRRLPPKLVQRLLPTARRLKASLVQRRQPAIPPQEASRQGADLGYPVDVLFCPFTAVTYAAPGVRVVSIVYDLQHRIYPQFFSDEQILERDAFFAAMAARADMILCISEHTRQNLYDFFPTTRQVPSRVIPVSIHTRLKDSPAQDGRRLPVALPERPYLFYPANYWPHKNHPILLTAFGIFSARNPEAALDLVFTGALEEAAEQLRFAVQKMGLEGRVHFLPYLPERDLAMVFRNCSAVSYPSLFEGFGIPLLESFLFGKPVLCSGNTSLPEVGGDAAIYFDPRKPQEIAAAIERFLTDPDWALDFPLRAQARLDQFSPDEMLSEIREALLA